MLTSRTNVRKNLLSFAQLLVSKTVGLASSGVSLERQFDTNRVQTTFFLLIQQIDQRKPVLVGLIARILFPLSRRCPWPRRREERRREQTRWNDINNIRHYFPYRTNERTNEPTAVKWCLSNRGENVDDDSSNIYLSAVAAGQPDLFPFSSILSASNKANR